MTEKGSKYPSDYREGNKGRQNSVIRKGYLKSVDFTDHLLVCVISYKYILIKRKVACSYHI